MSDTTKLTAEKRTDFGKGAARKIRRAGNIPAVMYGHGTDPVHISLPGHDTMMALKQANALLTIVIDGDEQLALAKDVQRDPIKPVIDHVDLVVVRKGEKVTVDVPSTSRARPLPRPSSRSTTTPSSSRSSRRTSPRTSSSRSRASGRHADPRRRRSSCPRARRSSPTRTPSSSTSRRPSPRRPSRPSSPRPRPRPASSARSPRRRPPRSAEGEAAEGAEAEAEARRGLSLHPRGAARHTARPGPRELRSAGPAAPEHAP